MPSTSMAQCYVLGKMEMASHCMHCCHFIFFFLVVVFNALTSPVWQLPLILARKSCMSMNVHLEGTKAAEKQMMCKLSSSFV